jgi:hypothetical protein
MTATTVGLRLVGTPTGGELVTLTLDPRAGRATGHLDGLIGPPIIIRHVASKRDTCAGILAAIVEQAASARRGPYSPTCGHVDNVLTVHFAQGWEHGVSLTATDCLSVERL